MAELFVISTGLLLALLLAWGIRTLPCERWQIVAAVPARKSCPSTWQGINYTYYGLFTATAQALAVALFFVLLRAIGVPATSILLVAFLLLALCLPASRLIARLVEKKPYTFTVGGAAFVGILAAPLIITFANGLLPLPLPPLPLTPTLAAMAIAYLWGEGLGRLACLSFGCCYGKPLRRCHPALQRLFARHATVFSGQTKKAAYEGGLAGEPLVPVQAMSCVVLTAGALAGLHLYLNGAYRLTIVLLITFSQLWRFASETLRADHRGEGRISAYQLMGLAAVVYIWLLTLLLPDEPRQPDDILAGLASLWHPGAIVFFQALWWLVFIATGRSRVTRSTLAFEVVHDHV